MKKITKFIISFLLLALALFFISCFVLDKIQDLQEQEIVSLKSKIIPMRFTLQQRGSSFEVEYSLLDLKGDIIKTKKELIRGNEFFIDCIVKDFNSDVKVAFPVIFYSNVMASSDGVLIAYEYNKDGFPDIFRGVTTKEKKRFVKLYDEVLNETKSKNTFRSSPHILATEKKETYVLVSRIRGGLEILKADDAEE
ncbi:MAG: hypothetical protein P1P64_00200 [Treponemataceae bacterium]